MFWRSAKQYKFEIILSFLLVGAYFFLRLIYLHSLPLFTDEAIYIRWAQISLHDASWRFISLTDGKQPLFIWVMMIFLKVIKDPLIAGRLVSVMCGFFTMVGLCFVTYELFRKKQIVFLTALFYICFPFAQVLDRMAIYDSMVAAFVIWSLYFSILLVKHVRLDIAYTLGFFIGGGILTKSNAFFSAYLLPFTLLLFNFKKKNATKSLLSWMILAFFSLIISQVFYMILRLSPLFGVIQAKNATFVYPFSEWIEHPLAYFIPNFQLLTLWLCQYLTASYILLIMIALLLWKSFLREKLLLLVYFCAPFMALALFGRVIFPRFIFFMSIMLLPLVALGFDWISTFLLKQHILKSKRVTVYASLLMLTCIYPLFVAITFVFDPLHAPIAAGDRGQYVASWAAGWGVQESVSFFAKESQNKRIFVGTQGTFGLMPEALEIYFTDNKNITTRGYWPISTNIPTELIDYAKKMPTFILFYQGCNACDQGLGLAPSSWPVKKVLNITKENGDVNMTVYKVISK